MELAVEFLGRAHPHIELIALTNGPIIVGRGFRCDLLLQDPRVDPAHLSIQVDAEQGMVVHDLGSTNGTFVNGIRLPREGSHPLHSGDTLQLGKTRLRIYERDHDVGPASAPSAVEQLKDRLHTLPWLMGVTCLSLAIFLLLHYLHFGADYQANIAVRRVLDFGLQAGLWTLFWGSLNKLIRGEFNFVPHWCLGAAVAALLPLLDEALAIVGFNWQSLQGFRLLDAVMNFVLMGTILYIALTFSTHLTHRARLGAALLPALLLLVSTYALPLLSEQRMVASPQLLSLSRPPAFKVASDTSVENFVTETAALFLRADSTALEQLEKERRNSTEERE